jgi:septal ring-binding cell division protein DamX
MSSSNANSLSAMDVQLEPQSQLLSRIQYVIGNESQFSFLSGEPGVGKSFIVSSLVETLTNTLVIKLSCREKFESEPFKQELICQLATDDLSEISQSLTLAIQEAINYYGQSILIVIDNAHHMPRAFVSSLWGSFCEALSADLSQANVNILLVGHRTWAKPIVNRLLEIRQALVSDFELAYLTSAQARDFITAIHPDWSDQKVINNLAQLDPEQLTPKALIFFEPKSIKSSKKPWVALLAITLTLSGVGVGWWVLNDAPSLITEPTSMPQAPSVAVLTEMALVGEQANESEQDVAISAPVVSAEPNESVTSPESSQMMTEQADSPMAEEPLAEESLIEESLIEEPIIEDIVDEVVRSAESELEIPQQPELEFVLADSPVNLIPVVARTEFLFDEESLLSVPRSHVSLMLGGYSTKSVLDSVLVKIKDHTKLAVYKTTRLDKDWFVLLYGDFATSWSARQALASKDTVLAGFSPWIKSFKVINAEISAAAVTVDNNK